MKIAVKSALLLAFLFVAPSGWAADVTQRLMVNPVADFALNPRNADHLMNHIRAQATLFSYVNTTDIRYRTMQVSLESEIKRMIRQGPGVVAMGSGTSVVILSNRIQPQTEALVVSVNADPSVKWATVPQEWVAHIHAALADKNVREAMGRFFDNALLPKK